MKIFELDKFLLQERISKKQFDIFSFKDGMLEPIIDVSWGNPLFMKIPS